MEATAEGKELKDCTNHQLVAMLIPDLNEIVEDTLEIHPELVAAIEKRMMTTGVSLFTDELARHLITDLDDRIAQARVENPELMEMLMQRQMEVPGVRLGTDFH
jgi:hypothetical protein